MPLKNNYVQVPNTGPTPNNVLDTLAEAAASLIASPPTPQLYGSEIVNFGISGSDNYLYGSQRFYRFGGINARDWYSNGDPTAALNSL
jgi:hypothetical protein